ncbi:hypothetical protein H4R19_006540, partial [Coemansia spiralis]
MLPHRSMRALLVPVLCVALLAPQAATSGARHRPHLEPTLPAADSAGGTYAPLLAHYSHQPRDPAVAAPAAAMPIRAGGDNGDDLRRRPRAADGAQLRSRGLVFLDRDGGGTVPRKFTIPEPSVVADAEHKHVAVLPSRPYAAAGRGNRLRKRSMLERSGVSLARVMVVVTVDGWMHGVDRRDGSILWSRRCLFESAGQDCQRGMVQTKGHHAGSLEGDLQEDDGRCGQDSGDD